MNKVILIGRLTRDPEVRYTKNGLAVATFTLAVDHYAGQGQRETDFVRIVAWDKLAERCGNTLTKGRKILIEGRLRVRTYETNEGQKREAVEVVANYMEFLEPKSSGASRSGDAGDPVDISSLGTSVLPDEEIPF